VVEDAALALRICEPKVLMKCCFRSEKRKIWLDSWLMAVWMTTSIARDDLRNSIALWDSKVSLYSCCCLLLLLMSPAESSSSWKLDILSGMCLEHMR